MIHEYINKPGAGMFILLAPLDWGLGHATRCIPLIRALHKHGAGVILGAEGPTASLLHTEFPFLEILPLKGYRIRYGNSKRSFIIRLLTQVPGIYSTKKKETRWLKEVLTQRPIHGIISDNRFGFYVKKLPSVYITHQLLIETGVSWLNKWAQKIHYRIIGNFSECWVPDNKDKTFNLAGKLSHPETDPPVPVKYIGTLSRFQKNECTIVYDLLILLSGPEPQRTVFENLLAQQLQTNKRSVVLVRGLPGEQKTMAGLPGVTVYNHLPAAELGILIQQSRLVLARAGFSTIMDLASLQKKAILVPTPGQGEQEYLAEYLYRQNMFYTCTQDHFNLEASLQKAETFSFVKPGMSQELDDQVIHDWLVSIKNTRV